MDLLLRTAPRWPRLKWRQNNRPMSYCLILCHHFKCVGNLLIVSELAMWHWPTLYCYWTMVLYNEITIPSIRLRPVKLNQSLSNSKTVQLNQNIKKQDLSK